MPQRNPQSAIRNPQWQRRASALAEFVLFLPFALFIISMIFHFGVSMLRKQRTIVAARFAAELPGLLVGSDATGRGPAPAGAGPRPVIVCGGSTSYDQAVIGRSCSSPST